MLAQTPQPLPRPTANVPNQLSTLPSTVHTDCDESAGRTEDLLLAPLLDRPFPGQTRLRQRCSRRGNRPLEGLRAHLPQLGGQVHATLHVRCEHRLCARDRWQQHLLPAGIVSSRPLLVHWECSWTNLASFPLQLCHQLRAGTQQQWQLREPLRCWSPGAFRLRLSPTVSGVQRGLGRWLLR